MAFPFRTPIDLNQNELRNPILHNLSSDPGAAKAGFIYYNTSTNKARLCTNATGPVFTDMASGTTPDATTGAKGIVQLAGDLAGTGTTAAAPLIGQVSQLANGLVGSPAVRFNASASTGLYSSATNTVNLAANGVKVFESGGVSISLPIATTVGAALTVSSGGLTVSAGGAAISGTTVITGALSTSGGSGTATFSQALTVSAGGITVTAGTTALQATTVAGTLTANGGLTVGASQTINLGGNIATNGATPSAATDLATKGYVDSTAAGLDPKASVVAASTGSETFTIAAGSVTQIAGTTLDGVSPAVGDRILIKDAPATTGVGSVGSTQPGNGIYTVTNATTNLTVARATDQTAGEFPQGDFTFVTGGTANKSSGWVVSAPTTTGAFTFGTNNIAWTQFSGAGEITAGTGLAKVGNTLSIENGGVLLPAHGGTGVASPTAHGVLVAEGASAIVPVAPTATTGVALVSNGTSADPSFAAINLAAAAAVTGNLPVGNGGTGSNTAAGARTNLSAPGYQATTITGNGALTSFTITPAFTPVQTGTVNVQIINASTGAVEVCDVVVNQALNTPNTGPVNMVTLGFGTAPANALVYNVSLVG